MTSSEIARWFAIGSGVVLILMGLLGFIGNPIASTPENNPLFVVDPIHNLIHIVTGAAALFVGYSLRGEALGNGLMVLGAGYGLVLLLTLVDPDAFGLLQHPVNAADHVLHVALTVAFLGVGWMARSARETRVRRT